MAPDVAHHHYRAAVIWSWDDQETKAIGSMREAIRLDPNDPDYFGFLSDLKADTGCWDEALALAESGLALNATHAGCLNARARALENLNEISLAKTASDQALHSEPEDARSHATRGWLELKCGNRKGAREHFAEALRLYPDYEYARLGLLEVLKARNPLYRWARGYLSLTGKIGGSLWRWALISICSLIAFPIVFTSDSMIVVATALVIASAGPLLVLLMLFSFLVKLALPLINLLLRLDRFGWLVMSAKERRASNWFGAVFLGTAGALAAYCAGWEAGLGLFFILLATAFCLMFVFNAQKQMRKLIAWLSAALFVYGAGGWAWVNWSATGGEFSLVLGITYVFAFTGLLLLAHTK
jgi:tetratricopeptide (TPR) repeat protein